MNIKTGDHVILIRREEKNIDLTQGNIYVVKYIVGIDTPNNIEFEYAADCVLLDDVGQENSVNFYQVIKASKLSKALYGIIDE